MIYAQNKEVKGKSAFLFGYYAKENSSNEFVRGYKKHLEWHKERKDPLVWYGWFVQTGDRIGLFIDGTFGINYKAFDNRIDPANDYADFVKTTAPYANPQFRQVYEMKEEFSSSKSLEEYKPTNSLEAHYITTYPGKEIEFEQVLSQMKYILDQHSEDAVPLTVYKVVSGGPQPGYMLLVHRNNFEYFENKYSFISLGDFLLEHSNREKSEKLLEKLNNSVKSMKSETWAYRADLSLIPGNY